MDSINVKAILNNEYDDFRDSFYNTLQQKYNENPLTVEFNKKMSNNDKIHEYMDIVKGNIKDGLLGSPKQMLYDNKN